MPTSIAISEMPEFTRVVTKSKWADVAAYTRDHFENTKTRDSLAIGFGADDGVTEENWGAAAQAIRNAAKPLGFKVRLRWDAKQGILFAKSDGPYQVRGPRQTTNSKTSAANNASKAPATKAAAKGRR